MNSVGTSFFTNWNNKMPIDLAQMTKAVETALYAQYISPVEQKIENLTDTVEKLNSLFDKSKELKESTLNMSIAEDYKSSVTAVESFVDSYNDYLKEYKTNISENYNINGTTYSKEKEFISPIKNEIYEGDISLNQMGVTVDQNGFMIFDIEKFDEKWNSDSTTALKAINDSGKNIRDVLSRENPVSEELNNQMKIKINLDNELSKAEALYSENIDKIYTQFAKLQSVLMNSTSLFDGMA